jgi:hypothetical protein
MDSEGDSKQKSAGDSLPNDSDFSEPFRVRHIGLQTEAINQRLLEYNVRALCFCVPIIFIIAIIL